MAKLIGYARVSTRDQSTDRQEADLLAAGVRRDDLYVERGVSGARASRPAFDNGIDTLVITTLDRLGRSTQNMPSFAQQHPWARCSSRSWLHSLRWNTRSNANASPTPPINAAKLAAVSGAGRAKSLTARSATPSASLTAANPTRKSPGILECPEPPSTGGHALSRCTPTATPVHGRDSY